MGQDVPPLRPDDPDETPVRRVLGKIMELAQAVDSPDNTTVLIIVQVNGRLVTGGNVNVEDGVKMCRAAIHSLQLPKLYRKGFPERDDAG